jgi:hypothetical protein
VLARRDRDLGREPNAKSDQPQSTTEKPIDDPQLRKAIEYLKKQLGG